MIKVAGLLKQYADVEITPQALYSAALDNLDVKQATACLLHAYKRSLDLPAGAYIHGTKWYFDEEVYTSHSFTRTNRIRDAKSDEIETYNYLVELYNK